MSRLRFLLPVVLLCACSLVAPLPAEPQKELLQQLPAMPPRGAAGQAVVLVTPPEAEPLLDTTRIPYTRRPFEIGYFNDHEWAEKPARMIQGLLIASLRASGRFGRVAAPPDFGSHDLVLHSRLLALTQDYGASPPVVRVAMHFDLADRHGTHTIGSRDVAVDEPIHGRDAHAGVVAANGAIARMLREAVQFVMDNDGS